METAKTVANTLNRVIVNGGFVTTYDVYGRVMKDYTGPFDLVRLNITRDAEDGYTEFFRVSYSKSKKTSITLEEFKDGR
jgi:hypothetical protein